MTSLEQRAKECAGNWLEFESFCWHGQPEDAHDWHVWYTENRDSGLLEQSNAEQINKSLGQFIESGDVVAERHRHWAVGWVAGYAIRVYKNGTITPAFIKCAELLEALEEYPVLNEEHYGELEYEAALEGIRSCAKYDTDIDVELPDEFEYAVFEWLWDNSQGELENWDGTGAYPSTESVERAVRALYNVEVE